MTEILVLTKNYSPFPKKSENRSNRDSEIADDNASSEQEQNANYNNLMKYRGQLKVKRAALRFREFSFLRYAETAVV